MIETLGVIWVVGLFPAFIAFLHGTVEYDRSGWWALGIPVWPLTLLLLGGLALAREARRVDPPWSEAARIRREIKFVNRERELLVLRRGLDAARADYDREFNRYLNDEPAEPVRRIGRR